MSQDTENPEEAKDAGSPIDKNATKQPQVSRTVDQSHDDPDAARVERPRRSLGRKILVFLIILSVLLIAAWAGYFGFVHLSQYIEQRDSDLARLTQRVAGLEVQNGNLEGRQLNMQHALTAMAADAERQMAALAERIAATETQGSSDWTLAEVEYLLRIANQRLATSGDIDTAVRMLSQADAILQELGQPELVSIRRQLAADIAKLQLSTRVDIEGIFFELEAIAAEIGRLDVFEPEHIAVIETETAEADSRWDRIRGSVTQILERYIRIQRPAGPRRHLLTQNERQTRMLAIQVQIRQAQLALLSRRTDIFSEALQSAAADLNTAHPNQPRVQRVAASLGAIGSMPIGEEPHNIDESIQMLSAVVSRLSRLEDYGSGGRRD